MSDTRRQRFSLVSIGAAACAACCAGPIIALLAGLSLAGLASTFVIGTAGLVVAGLALTGIVIVRQRRVTATCHATQPDPVRLAAPTRKTSR